LTDHVVHMLQIKHWSKRSSTRNIIVW